ncbi:MAG: hypothetical protein M1830_009921 [Pleopsidium flavum]|nr:MAG: hypothetical protein M1830_009921 [Pleopsidium flavum]
MIVNTGLAIVRRLAPDRVVQLSYKSLRVINTAHTASGSSSRDLGRFANGIIISIGRRSYATKPASRPKAHTGRTTTKPRKKAATTAKSAATKEPAAVKAKPTPKVTAKAIPKSKPKPKPKSKSKVKAKAKPPPTRRLKKAPTPEQATKAALQKERAHVRELKNIALTKPKLLPATAYLVLCSEVSKAGHGALGKETAAKYKELTPEQLEHYNHIANQSKVANDAAYKKWVLSHTVDEIKRANNARLSLKRRHKKTGVSPIRDDRLVKRPTTSYAQFLKERIDSGDLKHMKIAEMSRLVAREWKGLNSGEKKKYEDLYNNDLARYRQEVKTVYNREVSPPSKAAAAA